jgi:hypothetical protein
MESLCVDNEYAFGFCFCSLIMISQDPSEIENLIDMFISAQREGQIRARAKYDEPIPYNDEWFEKELLVFQEHLGKIKNKIKNKG